MTSMFKSMKSVGGPIDSENRETKNTLKANWRLSKASGKTPQNSTFSIRRKNGSKAIPLKVGGPLLVLNWRLDFSK